MSRRLIGNFVATLFGTLAAVGAIWASRIMKRPDSTLDWIVLALSALTAFTIVFFITWGHFQAPPIPSVPLAPPAAALPPADAAAAAASLKAIPSDSPQSSDQP